MNFLLWIIQIVVSVYCVMGASWRLANYDEAASSVPSVGALSKGAWTAIGIFEILCALGLILPMLVGMGPGVTMIAAVLLCIEMLGLTALHAKHAGFTLAASNPAVWTFGLAVLSALIAWGR